MPPFPKNSNESYDRQHRALPLMMSVLVALFPTLIGTGRLVTPDIMSVFGLVLGFSLLVRQRLVLGALALLATVFVRTDAGVFAVLLTLPVLLTGDQPLRRRATAAAMLLLAIPIVLALNSIFEYPGWVKLLANVTHGYLLYPLTADVSFVPAEYFKALFTHGIRAFLNHSLWITMIFFVILACKTIKESDYYDPILLWYGTILIFIPIRIALGIIIQERYFVFIPVLMFLLWAQQLQPRRADPPGTWFGKPRAQP